MNFGFGIGDFIKVTEFANKIRKDFSAAPKQYQGIALDVKNLSIILQDVDTFIAGNDLSESQEENLCEIGGSCRRVLEEVNAALDKYSSLETEDVSTRDTNLKNRARRVWQRVKLDPKDFDVYRDKMNLNMTTLNTFLGGIDRDKILQLVKHQEQKEDSLILDWLTDYDYTVPHQRTARDRVPGTGQWLLDLQLYQTWHDTMGKVMLIHGIPGSGKTTICSMIVDHLQEAYCLQKEVVGLCYFYCEYTQGEDQRLDNIMLCLLRQLAERSVRIPLQVRRLFDEHSELKTRPSLDKIKTTFSGLISAFNKVYLVVDAIDECRTLNGYQSQFIGELLELAKTSRINILVTARSLPPIKHRFVDCMILELQASSHDIAMYIDIKIRNFCPETPDLREEIKKTILHSADGMFLLAKLQLESLEGIPRKRQLRLALEKIAQQKGDYEKAYTSTMNRIYAQSKNQRDLAIDTLKWIVFAKRPLTLGELRHALATEPGESTLDEENMPHERYIFEVCCGLVDVEEHTRRLRLLHYTTKEYFLNAGSHWLPGAQSQLGRTCLTYLSLDEFASGECADGKSFQKRIDDFPLYSYASTHWVLHIDEENDIDTILHFLTLQQQVQASLQASPLAFFYPFVSTMSNKTVIHSMRCTALHLAAAFGLPKIVETLCSTVDVNCKDSQLRTPLWYAASHGHSTTADILLSYGAEADIEDAYKQTPRQKTIDRRQTKTLEVFLKHDGTPTWFPTRISGGLLTFTARSGAWDMVEMLCRRDAPRSAQDNNGCTALSYAAANGDLRILNLLISRGEDIEAVDFGGMSPLLHAAHYGNWDALQTLLQAGACATTIDAGSRNILAHAIRSRKCKRSQFIELLTHCVDLDRVDVDNMTPFHYTVYGSRKDLASLLLEHGVPVNLKVTRRAWLRKMKTGGHRYFVNTHDTSTHAKNTGYGLTALHFAALCGEVAMVEFLIERGADVNALSHERETALHLNLSPKIKGSGGKDAWWDMSNRVKYRPDLDVVGTQEALQIIQTERLQITKLLALSKSADLSLRDTDGMTALHKACEVGDAATAILLTSVDSIQLTAAGDQTVLHFAAKAGNAALFKQLLLFCQQNKLDLLGSRDQQGRTVLHYAAQGCRHKDFKEILQFYHEQRPGLVHRKDHKGRNVLHIVAAELVDHANISLLLDHHVSHDELDYEGFSPIMRLFSNGSLDLQTCELLVDRGIDLRCQHADGRALAHIYAGSCDLDDLLLSIVAVLHRSGLRLDQKDNNGQTFLYHAVKSGFLSKALLDLSLCYSPSILNTIDKNGKNLLDYAQEVYTLEQVYDESDHSRPPLSMNQREKQYLQQYLKHYQEKRLQQFAKQISSMKSVIEELNVLPMEK